MRCSFFPNCQNFLIFVNNCSVRVLFKLHLCDSELRSPDKQHTNSVFISDLDPNASVPATGAQVWKLLANPTS